MPFADHGFDCQCSCIHSPVLSSSPSRFVVRFEAHHTFGNKPAISSHHEFDSQCVSHAFIPKS